MQIPNRLLGSIMQMVNRFRIYNFTVSLSVFIPWREITDDFDVVFHDLPQVPGFLVKFPSFQLKGMMNGGLKFTKF